ncbi:MAG: PDZ domain-containing protein [Rhodospirillaceae bacterium]|nr:PDZ domain-containing protein [Rhodospirillaceae bacterium]
MRKTRTVVTMTTLACGLVAAGTVAAQFGPIGTEGARPRGDFRTRTADRDPRDTQAGGPVVQSQVPAAWQAVWRFRSAGRPVMLGLTINDHDQGVAVLRVSVGGPADEHGVETGDLIVAVNGVELAESERRASRSPTEILIAQMGTINLGDTVTLTVRRGEDEQDVEMEVRASGPDSYFVL